MVLSSGNVISKLPHCAIDATTPYEGQALRKAGAAAGALAVGFAVVTGGCSTSTPETRCYLVQPNAVGGDSIASSGLNLLTKYIGVSEEKLEDGSFVGLSRAAQEINTSLSNQAQGRKWPLHADDIYSGRPKLHNHIRPLFPV